MGIFKRKVEERTTGEVVIEDALLKALLSPDAVSRDQILGIPSISACVDIISNVVSAVPIKLQQEKDGKVSEIKNDIRTRLLNDETGDTLNGTQFKKAMITDFLIDKGGYAYIKKERNKVSGLYYVDCMSVTISKNTDPIFKDYDILVNGATYKPYDFLKFLRNTKDGAQSSTVMAKSPQFLAVVLNSLIYENVLAKTGGNKKGFLKTDTKLTQEVIDLLKTQWKNLYGTTTENCVVLNKGLDFKESSASSVEMQMNENKKTNAEEACKLFTMPPSIISGSANEQDKANFVTYCIGPILEFIQCALNRDLLLEKEKETMYFACDAKQLTKIDIDKQFSAYKTAVESNFMQIDEVRYELDLEPLGLTWVKLGLDSVLYNPKTKEFYTPNTNQTNVMGENNSPKDGNVKAETGSVGDEAQIALEGTVASISLNGAQIQSLLQIVTAVASNQLQYSSAIVLITSAFPFDETVAKSILGNPKLLNIKEPDNEPVKGGENI